MDSFDKICSSIISPHKLQYNTEDLNTINISGGQVNFVRQDFDLVVEKNHFQAKNDKLKLKCSFYQTPNQNPLKKDCIIYIHSHGSSRLEAIPLLEHAIPHFNVCIFDSRASGLSEGEFITLGIQEAEDLQKLLQFLLINKSQTKFYLWGRSVGGVTVIQFLNKLNKQLIEAVILDSPFTTLKTLVQ